MQTSFALIVLAVLQMTWIKNALCSDDLYFEGSRALVLNLHHLKQLPFLGILKQRQYL